MNIVETIRNSMIKRGAQEHAALLDENRKVCYRELFSAIDGVAVELHAAGVTRGSRVVFYCQDSMDDIIGSLAILSLSAILIPVHPSSGTQELNELYDRIGADFLFYERALCPVQNGTIVGKGIFLDKDFGLCPMTNKVPFTQEMTELNLAFIRFSSGTTSLSKGVLLSHETIIDRITAANRGMQITSNDTILWVLSMSYHFVVSILLFLREGATICLCYDNFPKSLENALSRDIGTFCYASPYHYSCLIESEQVSSSALQNIRMAISTAVKLPVEIEKRFLEKFGFGLTEAYGIIEVGLPFINDKPGQKFSSVGRLLPDYEFELRNRDQDGIGEIFIRGPGMFDGYASPWYRREANSWFDAGDLGRLDSEGYLYIVGRKKNVINFAGMKVYPYEVEMVLARHPAVKEVLVYGRPHPRYNQLPCAKVVLEKKADVNELQSFCMLHLSTYKVPKCIEIVSSLPKTRSGKISRVIEVESNNK
jgi:long-chain acyl-CoA synthetase